MTGTGPYSWSIRPLSPGQAIASSAHPPSPSLGPDLWAAVAGSADARLPNTPANGAGGVSSQSPPRDRDITRADEVRPPISIVNDIPLGTSPTVEAAVALRGLTRLEALTDEAWIETAQVFRRTFRKLRQSEPRHADLAQIVSDALRYTMLDGLSDRQRAMEPLERAGDALLDSFIPTEVELTIQRDLLAAGWKLTRPYGGRSLTGAE